MALKVLLADESSTIKKVFQLALQDFAVEVKSVNVGLDVVDVAESFQPDIIFADVLLQKRSGYDVSADIKGHPSLKDTPVVIMWSGFMELDSDKFQASAANGQLEKPFDVDGLRTVIRGLVSKTKTQSLADFLDFPDLPEFEEGQQKDAEDVNSLLNLPESGSKTPEESGAWDMESFDSIEDVTSNLPTEPAAAVAAPDDDFTELNLTSPIQRGTEPHKSRANEFLEDDEEDNDWVQKDISKYQVDADPDLNAEDSVSVNYIVPDKDASQEPIPTETQPQQTPATEPDPHEFTAIEELDLVEEDVELAIEEVPAETRPPEQYRLSEERFEEIIRAQSEEMLEKVVWKVVPDLASRIIERELDRLLKERDL